MHCRSPIVNVHPLITNYPGKSSVAPRSPRTLHHYTKASTPQKIYSRHAVSILDLLSYTQPRASQSWRTPQHIVRTAHLHSTHTWETFTNHHHTPAQTPSPSEMSPGRGKQRTYFGTLCTGESQSSSSPGASLRAPTQNPKPILLLDPQAVCRSPLSVLPSQFISQ